MAGARLLSDHLSEQQRDPVGRSWAPLALSTCGIDAAARSCCGFTSPGAGACVRRAPSSSRTCASLTTDSTQRHAEDTGPAGSSGHAGAASVHTCR